MKVKVVIVSMFIITLTFNITGNQSILNNYSIKEKIYSSHSINTHYTGPIFATGGAMSDINRYICDMEPTKIGHIEQNSLTLIESDTLKNQIYTFNKITAYTAASQGQSFSIIYLKCKMGNETYEIVIELKEGPNYDRTIHIYKNKKPTVLILWVDNARIVQKKKNVEI